MQPRSEILDWSREGRIADLRRALEVGGALPGADAWRGFLDRLLLFMGAVMLAAAVVFFFAYNWTELGRLAKFALVELPILVALGFVWRLGTERLAGKAALLVAAILAGALLALIGQVYQTGADTFELFTAWALAILPWTLLARFPALWVFWLALLNLAATLYYTTFHGLFGMLFSPPRLLWILFGLNTAALLVRELAAMRGVTWLRERWSARILAVASGALITALALYGIFDRAESGWHVAAWLFWLGAAYAAYRHATKDVFVLAGGALSVIVVVPALIVKGMEFRDAGGFLFIGLAIIGLSAAAGYWLRQVALEEDATEMPS